MIYVYRNNTIENFFDRDYVFSGYGDIGCVPSNVDGFLWWYQMPLGTNQNRVAEEILNYIEKLKYVIHAVPPEKQFVIMTMEKFFSVTYIDSDDVVGHAIAQYNGYIKSLQCKLDNVKVIDISDFTCRYALDDMIEWRYYFTSQVGMNPKYRNAFKLWFNKKMESIRLARKKCLILDLDNTLWGGVLGEDGKHGILLGEDYPGNAYQYFQNALNELSKTGVLLAICSKNNESDVMEVWKENPNIVLKWDSITAHRINWQDKSTNIQEIAEELNLGLDSMVFIDDNPAEREWVRQRLPMVTVPEFPEQPYMLPVFFRNLVDNYFRVYSVTEEDKRKPEQYKASLLRNKSQKAFANMDDFIASLDIRLEIENANSFNIQRIAQMTQKTNQFNLTTKRYSDADIRALLNENWHIWCLRVQDRFGDSGISGCVFFDGRSIDTFLLSCRVLGKGIEKAFLISVLKILHNMGFAYVDAVFIPTAKNMQVKCFYEQCGFMQTLSDEQGRKYYHLCLNDMSFEIGSSYSVSIRE